MSRDTIFISHATPEDNDFTIWLASRLKLLGYKVWVDKNGLIGGEKFWEEIDNIIRNKAVKFLFVYSNNICQKDENGESKAGQLKDGIYKEFSLAESIGKQNGLKDFIVLMNIDGVEYNLFIGADRLNQIPFYDSWSDGLGQLEKKLLKDEIIKTIGSESNFGNWYNNKYVAPNGITTKNELYYSNWWAINKLPEIFYVYQFRSEKQARALYEQVNLFPVSKITNHLSSFQPDIKFIIRKDGVENEIIPQNIFEVKLSNIFLGFDTQKFPTHRDSENHLKALLKRIFHLIMKERGMFWYEMSNKRLAYFYTPANLTSLKVKFEYPFRKTKKRKIKNLVGKHKSLGKWHYAVSVKPILKPVLSFSLKSHIVFTSDGFKVWLNDKGEIDTDKIHSQRRAKGKRYFNEEWRDMLIAFLHGLKRNDKISIELSENFTLQMPSVTQIYWADFGYFDPKDKTRHGLLSAYENDDELEDLEINE